jgi:drug/metabolite transporter (DMT)-like permease
MTQDNKGLLWGLAGVIMFAATLPMTKLAVGSLDAPQLSPWFVTFGRAAVAGLLSVMYLTAMRSRGQLNTPARADAPLMLLAAAGVVVGFPLFSGLALQYVPSTHAAVVIGLLPLATACVAALWYRQRPTRAFWVCAVLGSALVVIFMWLRSGGLYLGLANVYLLLAIVCTALGYIGSARLTVKLGSVQTICWLLVMLLPVTLPLAVFYLPHDIASVRTASWGAFAYVATVSMWIGFFFWLRGLAMGAVRVSQVQLVQPFFSLIFAVPLVGERLDMMTLFFAIAVIATVYVGKKMPVSQGV